MDTKLKFLIEDHAYKNQDAGDDAAGFLLASCSKKLGRVLTDEERTEIREAYFAAVAKYKRVSAGNKAANEDY